MNRGKVAAGVKELLSSYGCRISFNSSDVDLIIYLSGCTSNCARKYGNRDIGGIVVAPFTVDGLKVDESEMVAEIVRRVRKHYEQLER